MKRVVTRSDDKAEKDAVKLNEERGEVPSVKEGLDIDRPCGSTSRTRCQLVKLAKEFHCGDAQLLPVKGGAEGTEERDLCCQGNDVSYDEARVQ